MKRTPKPSVMLEGVAWVAGGALLLAYASAQWHFADSSSAGLQEFAAARERAQHSLRDLDLSTLSVSKPSTALQTELAPALRPAAPDMTSWSLGRVAAYQALDHSAAAQGVLRIPAVALEAPVYAAATESNLNRGVAWIRGTAPLGAAGNTGLASHRDGYFRSLRDIAVGDRIELEMMEQTQMYTVDDIQVVEPEDVHVLAPTSKGRLTLVTCYPFYMVGPAPKRFIVRAHAATPVPQVHAGT